MLQALYYYQTDCTDPHRNLAVEQYLLEHTPKNCCTLYLWQNRNTVVIGRNQNAWVECRTGLLEQEGGILARRLSGGGAVYHDLGNLNFTFLTDSEHYDLDRQLRVIQTACAHVGIRAEKSGRNDLLAEGHKFSGNAFYHNQTQSYHHGTLLIDVDMDKLTRYLSPPKAKLEAKGVTSVRSRVINLNTLCPTLTCQTMRGHMLTAFEEVYGLRAQPFRIPEDALAEIEINAAKNASWEWLYGARLPFSFRCEAKYPWGYTELQLELKAGTVTHVKCYTDAMEWDLSAAVEAALTGCRFDRTQLRNALSASPLPAQIALDLCALLEQQDF